MFSADSQVVIYNDAGLFEPNGIRSLQTLPTPPELADEPWLVPVGAAHVVELEPAAPMTRTLALTYLQRDVPAGYEHTLALYFLPQGATTWERLPTLQFVENLLVADLQAVDGVYAVMSTISLPALDPGWNAFSYPLPDTRPITGALASIQGKYAVVYAPAPAEQLDPGLRRSQPPAPAAERLTARTTLRIRRGPGGAYSARGTLQAGERVAVLATDPASGWRQIECPPPLAATVPCWVSGSPRYSSVAPEASPPAAAGDPLAGLQTNVDTLEFGRVYWIKITGDTSVVPYVAPPRLLPNGELPGSR
jgi:hypothetical protein